jgi:hypothetical protein
VGGRIPRWERSDNSIAGGLGDAAAVLGDFRIAQLARKRAQVRQRAASISRE